MVRKPGYLWLPFAGRIGSVTALWLSLAFRTLGTTMGECTEAISGAACLLLCTAWVACEVAQEPGPPAPAPRDPPVSTGRSTDPDTRTRVILLGTGTPIPDPRRAGPATAVVVGSRAYLVDAGPGVVRRAAEVAAAGVSALKPTGLARVFVTHLHSDHTVGLADLMLTPAVVGRSTPLQVMGPPGIADMVEHLQAAYAVDLQVRAEVEGASAGYRLQVTEVGAGTVYRDEAVTVRPIRVQHGSFQHAFGYRFEGPDRVVVVSGDTAPSDALIQACSGCDVLVHEVYCEAGLRTLPASVRAYHEAFHTSSRQLAQLAKRARPRLLVLTHLLPFGCSEAELLAELRRNYGGEVVLGEDKGVY
ncbi:MAG: MBL fold metallo-hydrolase [Myxococcales bacterium]|nr:MBL fold metallo-hydrolase [Myxococcales bacterium]